MISAVCAACAVALLVPASTHARARRVFGSAARRRVPGHAVAGLLSGGAVAIFFGPPAGWVAAVPVGLVVAKVVRAAEPAADRRHREAFQRQLPLVLDLLSAALAAGRPPSAAFAGVADAVTEPAASHLTRVAAALAAAGQPADVWRAVTVTDPLIGVARTLRRAESTGAPAARLLLRMADDLRQERLSGARQVGRSVAVRTAGPLGACFLPAFVLAGIVPTVWSLVGAWVR